jgi:hypothetical protein
MSQRDLVKMAFKLFNNWDEAWDQWKAKLLVATLRPPFLPLRWARQQHTPPGAYFKCNQTGHWAKKLPFTLLTAKTLSTMWPEWTQKGQLPSLPLQCRSVSHSSSHQTEGLSDLLGLAAEDWCGPGTSALFKISSKEPRVTIQVAGRPQSPTWCYLTSQVSFILRKSPWWEWMVSSTSQKKKKTQKTKNNFI